MPTLSQIFTALTGQPAPTGGLGRAVTPWVMNSALVEPGGGFVARPGVGEGSRDGHEFIGDAIQRGAAVVIAERARVDAAALRGTVVDLTTPDLTQFRNLSGLQAPLIFLADDSMLAVQRLAAWWRGQASAALKVVGVTGSVGKTTVKELVGLVLGQRFREWRSRGNYNSDIGLPLTLLDLPLDTERAVVEMGMTRPNEIRELAAIVRPDIGIVTNVGTAHMEQLGSIEAIAEAKGELVESLPADGLAILNGDDARVRAMAGRTQARVFLYGLQPGLDLWADAIESHGRDGISFRFRYGGQSVHARLPLLGRHSVHAALAAASIGLSQGQGWGEIIGGLKQVTNMEVLRVVVVEGINGSTLIDDTYNASPDSVMAALNLLNDLGGRRIAVLGEMRELGDFTQRGHELVARRAAGVATLFVAIGGMAPQMVADAQEAGMAAEATLAAQQWQEAVAWLRERLQPGDTVLVKGSRALRLDELVTQLSVSGGDV